MTKDLEANTCKKYVRKGDDKSLAFVISYFPIFLFAAQPK
jgi:hypothetical protein